MGIFGNLFSGGGGSSSRFVTESNPGLFDDPNSPEAAEFAKQGAGLVQDRLARFPGQGIQLGETDRPFFDQFSSVVGNPQFGGNGGSRDAIIKELVAQSNSANTGRGFFNPASSGTLAQGLFQKGQEFNQTDLSNLASSEQAFGSNQLQERQQDITSRLGSQELDLNNFNSIISALAKLSEQSGAITLTGQKNSGTSGPGILPSLIAGGGVLKNLGVFDNLFSSGNSNLNLDPQFGADSGNNDLNLDFQFGG